MPLTLASQAIRERASGAILLGLGVFLLCLVGIFSRPHADLASFWPANAFMLGMLIRFPRLATPLGWAACAAGFFLADAATGASLRSNLLLNGGNLLVVGVGYRMLATLAREHRTLKRPRSLLYFLRAVVVSSLTAGFIGTAANPLLFGGSPQEGFVFWCVTELVNGAAFTPMLLTLPPIRLRRGQERRRMPRLDVRRTAPLTTLIVSAAAGALIDGPGSVAFPVPALLWCALSYSLFTTACLSFLFGAWTMLAIHLNLMTLGAPLDSREAMISVRVGVTLIALAPLVVGGVMAARNDLLLRLRELADHDAMTGLKNRRAFIEAATAIIVDATGAARPTAVMLIDIDHFKTINDTYGHETGDWVITAFADVLKRNVRPQDAVGRVGGEEFAVILPNCGPAEAIAAAHRINAVLRRTAFARPGGAPLAVTASIGVHVARDDHNLASLMSHADKALYRAKHAGRNRFELSPLSFGASLRGALA